VIIVEVGDPRGAKVISAIDANREDKFDMLGRDMGHMGYLATPYHIHLLLLMPSIVEMTYITHIISHVRELEIANLHLLGDPSLIPRSLT